MNLPVGRIDTVFLDAGNTLLGMNHALMAEQLSLLGANCAPEALARAEAAARPALSNRIAAGGSTETDEIFTFYMRKTLETLLDADELELEQLAGHWVTALRQPQVRGRVWTRELVGVGPALERLRARGFKQVVVSNSDGTIEELLRDAGLLACIDHVIDSARVGVEKPEARIFELALELSGSRPESTLHVGDLYAVDVVGARAAGLHAALLDPFGDWPEMDCPVFADLPALAHTLCEGR